MSETIETCSALSLAHNEGINGTALEQTTRWMLLEVREAWPARITADDLPETLRDLVQALENRVEGFRLQLIRHPKRDNTPNRKCFIVRSGGLSPLVYRFPLASYEALHSVDVEGLLTDRAHDEGAVMAGPLYLVCTHGKRDQCCAKWGTALYKAMAEGEDERVWQATHLGGHRFAATMVCLPEGLQYGRLGQEDGAPLMDAHARGDLYDLDKYRGCTAWSSRVQAAEAMLRRELSLMSVGGVELGEVEEAEGGRSAVSFEVGGVGRRTVLLEASETKRAWRFSCAKPGESRAMRYDLVAIYS